MPGANRETEFSSSNFKSERRKCQTRLTSDFSAVLVELYLDQRAPAPTVLFYYHRIVHIDDDAGMRMCYAEPGPEKARDRLC